MFWARNFNGIDLCKLVCTMVHVWTVCVKWNVVPGWVWIKILSLQCDAECIENKYMLLPLAANVCTYKNEFYTHVTIYTWTRRLEKNYIYFSASSSSSLLLYIRVFFPSPLRVYFFFFRVYKCRRVYYSVVRRCTMVANVLVLLLFLPFSRKIESAATNAIWRFCFLLTFNLLAISRLSTTEPDIVVWHSLSMREWREREKELEICMSMHGELPTRTRLSVSFGRPPSVNRSMFCSCKVHACRFVDSPKIRSRFGCCHYYCCLLLLLLVYLLKQKRKRICCVRFELVRERHYCLFSLKALFLGSEGKKKKNKKSVRATSTDCRNAQTTPVVSVWRTHFHFMCVSYRMLFVSRSVCALTLFFANSPTFRLCMCVCLALWWSLCMYACNENRPLCNIHECVLYDHLEVD